MIGDDGWEICPRCAGQRERHIDRATGRYHITMPSRCDDKDRCEKEIMTGFIIEPQQQRA